MHDLQTIVDRNKAAMKHVNQFAARHEANAKEWDRLADNNPNKIVAREQRRMAEMERFKARTGH